MIPAPAAAVKNTNAAAWPRSRGPNAKPSPRRRSNLTPITDHLGFCDDCYDELAAASNAVLDLVDAEKLDAAEQAAHELLERFPDAHDGYARLGLVCEVRGGNRQAVEHYRKVIAFPREHPGLYDREFENGYQALIDRLEPTAAD
jgi:tetratricopeptide (TPR) repeat protein